MAFVEMLLRLPTDEVQSYPALITNEDVSLLLREMETVLRKCLYAIRYKLVTPFSIFLKLLLQPTVSDGERVAQALLTPAEEGHCIDVLVKVCDTLLKPEKHSFRSEIDMENFFEFIQLLCGSSTLKEPLGAVLMPCLLNFFCSASESEDDYRQPRASASVLITLIRGSKANKNRMSVECGRIGGALTKSNDIFFQMQCVELIFRLYTHNRTVLGTSSLSEFFKRGIAELPNDANLLTRIQSLLDIYNMEYNASGILQFPALLIEAGKKEVCGHTNMYFSPLILVIMIPGHSGDNITIPYEHIRSVRLSKERKLGLRLHVIPERLSSVLSLDAGKDTLMVSLTQSTFSTIRSSGINEWIAERKRRVPISRIRQRDETLLTSSTTATRTKRTKTTSEAVTAGTELASHLQKNHVKSDDVSNREGSHAVSLAVTDTASAPLSTVRGVNTNHNGNHKQKQQEQQKVQEVCSRDILTEKLENAQAPMVEGDAIRQLHEAASQKVARMRQEYQGELQCAVDFMQEELEKMRRINARERDDFEASVREDLTSIRRTEAQVKERAAECVQSLNQELTEVQALGELLKSEIDKVRENLANVLQRSESVEQESLVRVKALVDSEMKSMEGTLLQLISSTNPIAFLTNYFSRKIESGRV
ncbi:hypothetical protein LSM04_009371 [Trypanosoma melophagium]|uniref:uncharacterized protein n=1 Tax=Trypanosoma melophagium TaxID=715481 RepID=UPI00351A991F|nr:hypothetical protein LSM04_009371 [Trypanosoma melophagium]